MLAHIPVWVFLLLFALVLLGIWFSRTRATSPIAASVLAAWLTLYSLVGVIASFGLSPLTLLAWFAGSACSIRFLPRLATGTATIQRIPDSKRVLVAGSWRPMLLILATFIVRFTIGFAQGAHLPFAKAHWFSATCAIALGGLSGAFAARARTIWRASLASPTAQPA